MKNVKKTAKPKKEAAPKDEAPKEKTLGPFDYINDVMLGKKNLVRGSDNEELAEKGYNAFLTNRALSFHIDTVLYANEMNRRGGLDGLLQYEYYLHSVRPMKRGYFWPKKTADEAVQTIQDKYKVNPIRGREILAIIGMEGVEQIRKTANKGGVVK